MCTRSHRPLLHPFFTRTSRFHPHNSVSANQSPAGASLIRPFSSGISFTTLRMDTAPAHPCSCRSRGDDRSGSISGGSEFRSGECPTCPRQGSFGRADIVRQGAAPSDPRFEADDRLQPRLVHHLIKLICSYSRWPTVRSVWLFQSTVQPSRRSVHSLYRLAYSVSFQR